jgi:hypothetical protein
VGASGIGPLENDFAEDFCDDLRELDAEEALDLIRAALAAVVEVPAGSYLQRDLGEAAVAASAIAVAARLGRQAVSGEADVDNLPSIPDDIFPLVTAAARRVVQDDSEVRRLWDQVGAADEWIQSVDSLAAEARGIADRFWKVKPST